MRNFTVGMKCMLAVALALGMAGRLNAYSVQTHEQVIDLTWKASIVPLLQARFPTITPAQLREAHAYAYGGSAIQDIGYYPFGNALFSNLTHYVRTGDFVDALLRDAKTPDELAFAVGALSHYVGDSTGHSLATNPAVAAEFPGLAKKYGETVNYEENPRAHVRTEFAFDINEIAKHRFAPRKYLAHVGLKVAVSLLARAFYETYGLELNKTLKVERTDLVGYTFSVRHFLPRIAYAENLLHKNGFPVDVKDADFTALEADLRQAGMDNGWEQYRGSAGVGTYLLAGMIFVMPRVGVLSDLAIRGPNEQTEQLYVSSLNKTAASLRGDLVNLRTPPPATGPKPVRQVDFPNLDLDTGAVVKPGSYRLTDETYAKLLERLTRDQKLKVPVGLEEDILAFYADPSASNTTKRHKAEWARVQENLEVLKRMATVPEA